MANFIWGSRSLAMLSSCDDRLVKVAYQALVITPYDFGIIEGHRSLGLQMEAFNSGKSQIDGVTSKGNHNYMPSRAFDFLPSGSVNGVPVWDDVQRFSVIAGVI